MLHPTLDVYGMKCLEFDERSARLVVRPCTGQDNQLWDYDGWYIEARSLVMREQVCLSSLNEQLTAWPCNQIPEQRFDRYFAQLVAYEDGLCLSLLGGLDWDVETQAAGLALCSTSDPGQSWVFDCPAPNVCQDLCLGSASARWTGGRCSLTASARGTVVRTPCATMEGKVTTMAPGANAAVPQDLRATGAWPRSVHANTAVPVSQPTLRLVCPPVNRSACPDPCSC